MNKYLTILFPEEVCPVCGKTFIKRKDWGCVVTARGNGISSNSRFVRLCSIPCMKQYEKILDEKDAKHAATLRCCKSYKLHVIDGLSTEETAARLGHKRPAYVNSDCNFANDVYWKEIEWLEKHNAWGVAS